jgi:hypothetical protein
MLVRQRLLAQRQQRSADRFAATPARQQTTEAARLSKPQ